LFCVVVSSFSCGPHVLSRCFFIVVPHLVCYVLVIVYIYFGVLWPCLFLPL
jgi:hypothetical protein